MWCIGFCFISTCISIGSIVSETSTMVIKFLFCRTDVTNHLHGYLVVLFKIAEIMDFGYPQNLSPEILKLYITQEGVRSPFSSKVRGVLTYQS